MDLKTLRVVKNFNVHNLVKFAIFREISQYLITNDELEELAKTFKQVDINNDGQLQMKELIQAFNLNKIDFDQNQLDKIFKENDWVI